jgi:DNA invertase Pin-like site-specific DNA recombinase
MTLRAVTYSRVSTSDKGQNPDIQVTELRRYIIARGWNVAEEIIDNGFSGASDQRPGLKRLLSLVRARKIDIVVVVKLDRLFRSLKHLVTTLEDFQSLDVQFVAIKDNVDYSTPSGRLFVQILGSLAEFEKSLLRERTLAGLEYAKAHGKNLGRPRSRDDYSILKLRNEGMTYTQIQRQLGCGRSAIYRALKAMSKTVSKADFQVAEKARHAID